MIILLRKFKFQSFTFTFIFLLIMSCSSWAATTTTTLDPFRISSRDISESDGQIVYSRYGNGDSDFFYQLRDVTGASRSERVGGPQWFATVYENYYNHYSTNSGTDTAGIYRRTMGGGIPDIPFRAIGDILDGFNFVFAEEPEPYAAWTNVIDSRVYDVYPDPLETLCVVITNGQGEFNVRFGNPYARHFPFWWNWNRSSSSSSYRWWQNEYDWRTGTYPTTEPIEYIYYTSDSGIYSRSSTTGRYEKQYNYVESDDGKYYVLDLSGNTVLVHSDDSFYNTSDDVIYTVSGDEVYDSSSNLVYTIESARNDTTSKYICAVRNVGESIILSEFDDYNITVSPSSEGNIESGNYLDVKVNIRGYDGFNYGSKLGYITFRQRASFAPGYTNFREAAPIPIVIANVSNGNASDNPLIFDMLVSDEDGNAVKRIKFTWDAQSDMTNQDLGTFFMIQAENSSMPVYNLETRITNRTGTRYMLYRYDMGAMTNNNYREILPDYWKYDITPDLYGTLPSRFLLDAHSQIAPGLVTVYNSNVGSGYSTIDTQYDTSESFRLYEYASGTPRNLRLNYKRIRGMTLLNNETPFDGVNVREFSMQFMDVVENSEETVKELEALIGKPPVMVTTDFLASSVRNSASNSDTELHTKGVTVNSSAVDSFQYLYYVPEGLVSYDIIENDTSSNNSGDVESGIKASDTEIVYKEIAIQPVAIRMKISRTYQLLANHWEELNNANNSRELFNIFSKYGTIWVRSSAARERDTNLFTAINTKGAKLNESVSAADCVNAFINNDELYLDFIAVLADGKSINEGKTAYIEIFKDDNVPYILIGDGAEDGKWDLTFFVDAAGSNPETGNSDDSNNNDSNNSNNNSNKSSSSSSGGGGGCNAGIPGAIALVIMFAKKR